MDKTNRRQFIQRTLLGGAAAGCGLTTVPEVHAGEVPHAAEPEVFHEIDLLVVGGGTAGTIAAIQAGRAGAKVLLVERGSQLGGTTTTGGVSFPGLFDAWGKQIIAGIGWELVKESVELDGGTLPDFRKVPRRHWMNQVLLNQFLYAILAEEKCDEAGVEIAYHEFLRSVRRNDEGQGGWQAECVGFGTLRHIKCRQIIDCTGGAEVVGLAGFERMREEEIQPGSMLFRIDGSNDPGRTRLERLYVHGADSSNSRTVTRANLTGRQSILKRVREQGGRLTHLQPETGFRESYRIVGETEITVNDYRSGRKFEDAIANAFYPVDLHTRNGVKPEPLKRGVIPTIPLRALIPKGSRHLMVAGRSLSSDRLANSGLRVQAPCMAMGQAAAVTAVLACRHGVTPLDVPLGEIREMLRQHGAILPEDV